VGVIIELAVELRATENAPESSHAEIVRLREALAAQEETMAFLHRRHEALSRIEQISHAEIVRLREAVAAQEETMAFLHRRHETLCRVEQGGWWRLRGRLRPVLRLAGRLRALARGHDG
jgi:hypothetical protein